VSSGRLQMVKGAGQGRGWFNRAHVAVCIRLLCIVWLLVAPQHAFANDAAKTQQRTKLDVVLMLDSSGSMLKTDPSALRYEGVRHLTSFLTDGDRLGVVQFAGDAKVVQDLESFAPQKAEQIMQRIRDIPVEGTFTDITAGIKVGAEMFNKSPQVGNQRVIVVLSDGKVEPDPTVGPAFARTLQLVQEMLPELKAKEIRVFTVALSEQADRALLGEVAAATDGLTWYAQSAEDIHKTFSELFLALKRSQVVPEAGRRFSIDADSDEATFYINHAADVTLSLVSPKDEVMTAEKHPEFVTWFSGEHFDVITVKEPDLGGWRVTGGVVDEGFATVLTNLKLLTDWPVVVRAGDEPLLQARLYEDNKPVVLPEMSGIVKFGFQIVPTDKVSKPVAQEPLRDDGTQEDVIALDGIFSSRTGPLEVGSYKLTVVAKAPTFQRSQQIAFTVRPRLVTLTVRSPSEVFTEAVASPGSTAGVSRREKVSGGDDAEFSVVLSKEVSSLKTFKVSLVALSEDRTVVDLPLKKVSATSREYRAVASALPSSGTYRIKAIVQGSNKRGERVEAESQVVQFALAAGERSTTSSQPRHSDGAHPATEKESSGGGMRLPIVAILIISAINAIGFLMARRMVKSSKSVATAVGQRYLPPTQLLEAIELLETRSLAKSVAPDDPLFTLLENMSRSSGSETQQVSESAGVTQDSGEPV
jgi:hypothetical protein